MNANDNSKSSACEGCKMIALTFDDGPGEETGHLLDILARCGGKGTFFVIGEGLEDRSKSNILKRAFLEGHEIGNHTLNHGDLAYMSEKDVEKELLAAGERICAVTGKTPSIVRPPYGSYNEKVGTVGKQLGLSFIVWSVDTLDWHTKNADDTYEKIMSQAKSGDIILCHDPHKSTVDAMERVIPELSEKGFRLVTVTELMNGYSRPLEAGQLYYCAHTEAPLL